MRIKHLEVFVFGVLVLVWLFQMIHYYPLLPADFGASFHLLGQPADWSSKDLFFIFYGAVMAVLVAVFLGVRLALPRLPLALIAVPEKQFWTAPERRRETETFLGSHWLWFGCATLNVVIAMVQIGIEAGFGGDEMLGYKVWGIFAVYLAYTVGWQVWFVRRFRRER